MHRLLGVALATVIGAGTFAPAAQADPASDLAAARERWAARDARDYSYRLQLLCFCSPDTVKPTTVKVVRGKPRSTPERLRPYDTVRELFAVIEDALKSADEVSVKYARNTGIPTSVDVDRSRMVGDDEFTLKITRIHAPRGG